MTERDDAPVKSAAEPTRTVAGVIGLILVLVATLFVPLGCLSWGVGWYAIAPLAVAGLAFSLAGRGWMRVWSVALGGPLAGLGTAFWVWMLTR